MKNFKLPKEEWIKIDSCMADNYEDKEALKDFATYTLTKEYGYSVKNLNFSIGDDGILHAYTIIWGN